MSPCQSTVKGISLDRCRNYGGSDRASRFKKLILTYDTQNVFYLSKGDLTVSPLFLACSHLVIEVVERGFVFREMAEVTFRKVPHPQLIPEDDRDNLHE